MFLEYIPMAQNTYYGGFLKYEYPQIIQIRPFYYWNNHGDLGIPHGNPPYFSHTKNQG